MNVEKTFFGVRTFLEKKITVNKANIIYVYNAGL